MVLIETHHVSHTARKLQLMGSSYLDGMAGTFSSFAVAETMGWSFDTIRKFFTEMMRPSKPLLPMSLPTPGVSVQDLLVIFPVTRLDPEEIGGRNGCDSDEASPRSQSTMP